MPNQKLKANKHPIKAINIKNIPDLLLKPQYRLWPTVAFVILCFVSNTETQQTAM